MWNGGLEDGSPSVPCWGMRAVIQRKAESSHECCPRRVSGRTRGEAAVRVASKAITINIRCVAPARRDAGSHRARLA
eukprot:276443-Pleurochrysis_carterae.AAC.6